MHCPSRNTVITKTFFIAKIFGAYGTKRLRDHGLLPVMYPVGVCGMRGYGPPGPGRPQRRPPVRWLLVRAVVQRVSQASVTVDGQVIGAIEEPGLLVLVGVTHDDDKNKAARLASKLWGLRILEGEKSCEDLNAPLLVVSQFTLYAETNKGRRPTWINAAPGPIAEPLVNAVIKELEHLGARVATGKFGADMKVALVNDGPVTIILDL